MSEMNLFSECLKMHHAWLNIFNETTETFINNLMEMFHQSTPETPKKHTTSCQSPYNKKTTQKTFTNNLAHEYTDAMQQWVNQSLEQFFNMAEMAGQVNHITQKMYGLKSSD